MEEFRTATVNSFYVRCLANETISRQFSVGLKNTCNFANAHEYSVREEQNGHIELVRLAEAWREDDEKERNNWKLQSTNLLNELSLNS